VIFVGGEKWWKTQVPPAGGLTRPAMEMAAEKNPWAKPEI